MSCPNLEVAGQAFIKAFQEFAGKDEDKKNLNKDELYQLTVKEYPTLFGHMKKEDLMNRAFATVDLNEDNKVDFQEFMLFNSSLIMVMHYELHQ